MLICKRGITVLKLNLNTDWGQTHEINYKEALERKVGKTTLYREERYEVKVSRTVLKTSLDWKQFRLSLTAHIYQMR